MENDIVEPLAQWKAEQAKWEAERLAQPKTKPKANHDTEEITITYDKYKVKVTVQVKGDDRILAGTSLFSYPFLEKTTNRSWKIVEEKLIPDSIRSFNNGEVQFKTEYFDLSYLSRARGIWSKLSKHKIALISLKSAAYLKELKYKPGYLDKRNQPTGKLQAEVENYFAEYGLPFDDAVGEFLSFLNSVASLDFSSVSLLVEKLPRNKKGSLSLYSSIMLPISSANAFFDVMECYSFNYVQSMAVVPECKIDLQLGYISPKLD